MYLFIYSSLHVTSMSCSSSGENKLYQYSFWQLSLRVDGCVVCWSGVNNLFSPDD